jgi:hypothetical protein
MANTLLVKRSAVSGNTPSTSALALGELAVNTHDGKLFFKKDDGVESVVVLDGLQALDSYAMTHTAKSAAEVGYTKTSLSGRFAHLRGGLGIGPVTFVAALADAFSKGVRLPTVEELEDQIAKGTGGGYDSYQCWTCSAVAGMPGYVYTKLGTGAGTRNPTPTDDTTTAYTRYVADVSVPSAPTEYLMSKLLLTEGAAPDTPASGKVAIYAKADGRPYWKDDAGVEHLIQEGLTADRTYYVNSTTGDDANDGLAVDSPFATVQHAVDTAKRINNNGFNITFQLADGNYGPFTISGVFTGAGTLFIKGNDLDPTAVVFSSYAPTKYGLVSIVVEEAVPNPVVIESINFYYTKTALVVGFNSFVSLKNIIVNYSSGIAFWSYGGIILVMSTTLTFKGNISLALSASSGLIEILYSTITLDSVPSFSTFASADLLSSIKILGTTITGTATGKRYSASKNSVIYTGSGATFLPGDVAGTVETGGIYV